MFPMVDEWKDLFYNYSIIHSMTVEEEELKQEKEEEHYEKNAAYFRRRPVWLRGL